MKNNTNSISFDAMIESFENSHKCMIVKLNELLGGVRGNLNEKQKAAVRDVMQEVYKINKILEGISALVISQV